MESTIHIRNSKIGANNPVYLIAELSANHNHDFSLAVKLIQSAKEAGANAIKIQTYTPDTMTIDSNKKYFQIKGTHWAGKSLYQLYKEAHTPWEWQPKLKHIAEKAGLDFFSTAFDLSSVDFLESIGISAYKLASFEIIDIPLIKKIASTGKPAIFSTGMASLSEIEEAVETFFSANGKELALLKCTSSYPSEPEEMNLVTIPHMMQTFKLPVGLSDHSLSPAIPAVAVTMGACIIEKHFTLSRSLPGPDSAFSLEPHEFKQMVESVQTIKQALGKISYGPSDRELESRRYRRSLFAVKDIRRGEVLSDQNIRCIRPGFGLHPRYKDQIFGTIANFDIPAGTPITWNSLLRGVL